MAGLMRWLIDRLSPTGGATGARGPGGTLMPHELPLIFHHWMAEHVHPLLHEIDVADTDAFFVDHLRASAARTGTAAPRFLSLGSGNCSTEIRLAAALMADGLDEFTIECVEENPLLQSNGRAVALARGLDRHIVAVRTSCNAWRARHRYDGVLANGSLHKVSRLELLLDRVQQSLLDGAWFVVSARIGCNGHLRWPEALVEVRRWWRELPPSHRWNHQLRRHQQDFTDWDGRRIGDDGVRAQDVLPQLLQRFSVPVFLGYGNVIDTFVGPAFGPNFSPQNRWDRDFIAAVHDHDEELFHAGAVTPTRMLAVLAREPEPESFCARGLSPERCVRLPDSP